VPFLTNGRFLTDPEQLRLWVPLSRVPSLPPERPVSRDIVADPIPAVAEAPAAAEAPVLLGGVTATLDITVWRRRWFWRLAASFVLRRLRR
jgi:hypothetical protein